MHESASAEQPGAAPVPAGDFSTARPGPPAPPTPQARPGPPSLPGPRQTRVAAALAQLPLLDQAPLAGHPDLYQQIHGELQGALAEIDNA